MQHISGRKFALAHTSPSRPRVLFPTVSVLRNLVARSLFFYLFSFAFFLVDLFNHMKSPLENDAHPVLDAPALAIVAVAAVAVVGYFAPAYLTSYVGVRFLRPFPRSPGVLGRSGCSARHRLPLPYLLQVKRPPKLRSKHPHA